MTSAVLFRGSQLGARRAEIVRRLRYPDSGVTTVDDDTLAIQHSNPSQAEWTREELEQTLDTQVTIVEEGETDGRSD